MIHSSINNRPVLLSAFSFFFILSLHLSAQVPVLKIPPEVTFTQGIYNTDLIIGNTGGAIPEKLFATLEDVPASGLPQRLQQMVKGADGNFYGFESQGYRIIRIVPGGGSDVFAGDSNPGYADGEATAARFMQLARIAVDLSGNLYVAEINAEDNRNSRIRKITPEGKVSTFATGLRGATGMAVDKAGNVYVSEASWIRKYDSGGQYIIFAGQPGPGSKDGQGIEASFTSPSNIVFDSSEDLYVAEYGVFTRKVSRQGYVSTLSIRKIATESVAIDASGNFYSSSSGSSLVITFPSGEQSRLLSYGTGGLAIMGDELYVSQHNKLSRVSITGYRVSPNLPPGLVLKPSGRIGGKPSELWPAWDVKITGYNKWGSSSVPLKVITEIQHVKPYVKSFTPLRGVADTYMTIKGNYFLGATAVTIGGVPAKSFSITDLTDIRALAAEGVTSGEVSVSNPYGTGSLAGFVLIDPPSIDTIIPQSARSGAEITITGNNFEYVTNVKFGNYSASSFRVISATKLRAIVGNGGSGNVAITAAGGTGSKSGFVFIAPPVIASFTQNAGAGKEVIISGSGFTGTTSVKFGDKSASSFTVISDTNIKAIVGTGSSGQISVTAPGGTVTRDGFTWVAPPTITSFTPKESAQGRQIYISGTNLRYTTEVTLGGVPVVVYYMSDNNITATVGAGSSGTLKVVTAGGTASMDGFIFIPPPVITGFSPQSGRKGDLISITGEYFKEGSSVMFGGYYSDSVKVLSSTSIVARVGYGASGAVVVNDASGSGSLAGFIHSGPAISSFSPASGKTGTVVTITGTNFTDINQVYFGSIPAASFTVNSPTSITAICGEGEAGYIRVFGKYGLVNSINTFQHTAPLISSFYNPFAAAGSEVRITGERFTGVTSVRFGGAEAASFTIISDREILAVVSSNATSGRITVTSAAGSASRPGFNFLSAPHLTSFSPKSAAAGEKITLSGRGFFGVQSVQVAGYNLSFTIYSDTSIVAVVPVKSVSGSIKVLSSLGTDSLGYFTHTGPVITSFEPLHAAAGKTLTIRGRNFSGASALNFGSVPASAFTVVSDTLINAVVPAGAGSSIEVRKGVGSFLKSGFTFISGPSIQNFEPLVAGEGTPVNIYGSNFYEVDSVFFGGKPAKSFTVESPSKITAYPPLNSSGSIEVVTEVGKIGKGGFNWIDRPQVLSFSPATAMSGASIAITGKNFQWVKSVTLGGVPVSWFNVVSPTSIIAVAGNGETGYVSVSTNGGRDSISGFTFIHPPVINSFTVMNEGTRMTVLIKGKYLSGATVVKFGTVKSQLFRVNSPNEIYAVVNGGETGDITVITPAGTATIKGFIYGKPPVINSILPASGIAGTTITISGSGFNPSPSGNTVYFGSIPAKIISASSAVIKVVVPATAVNQPLSVTNLATGLGCLSPQQFKVIQPESGGFNLDLTGKTDIILSDKPRGLQIADIDGDGRNDLISVLTMDENLVDLLMFRNNISGEITASSFSDTVHITLPVRGIFGMGDINGDGFTDIVHCGAYQINLLINTSVPGRMSFRQEALGNYRPDADRVTIRDLDLDGRNDIIIDESGETYFYRNMSSFLPGVSLDFSDRVMVKLTGDGSPSSPSVNDLDADRRPDIVMGNGNGGLTIAQNTSVPGDLGTESFSKQPILRSIVDHSSNVSTGDLNGDDMPEIIEQDVRSGFLAIYKNIHVAGPVAETSFAYPQKVSFKGGLNLPLYVADMNGDGRPDIISMTSRAVNMLENTGSSSSMAWEERTLYTSDGYQGESSHLGMAVADLNGDGLPELVLIDSTNHKLTILHKNPVKSAVISSFNPTTAPEGAAVIITGRNLSTVKSVSFSGVPAKEFTLRSDSTIYAIVPKTSSGSVKVENLAGSASIEGFKFIDAPVISSFSPSAALEGAAVTISGAHFDNTSAVSFGSLLASFKVNSPTSITAYVPAGSRDTIRILSPGGLAVAAGFTRVIKPVISALGDTTFTAGGSVVLSTSPNAGYSYRWQRNGLPVPDARSSSITVTESGIYKAVIELNGYLFDSNEIIVTSVIPPAKPAVITSFIPTAAPEGASVFISGQNFSTVRSVSFGGVPATDFQLISDNTIYAIVPKTSSGAVMVINQGGSASMDGFKFAYAPVISSFSPAAGTEGTAVSISGKNFDDVIDVSFGGVVAAFTVNSPTSLTAFVPAGALDTIRILTSGGLASVTGFSRVTRPVISAQGNTTFGTGGSVVLNASPASGKTYRWYRNGIIIPEAGSSSIVATESGTYSAAIEVNGLIFTSNEIPVKVILVLPASNFKIQITAVSCRTENNGVLNITAGKPLDYILSVQGNNLQSSYTFNSSKEIQGLSAGRYSLCFTVAGQPDFKQCFDVVVTEPEDLSLLSYVDEGRNTLTLNMSGGEQYYIKLNDRLYQTAGTGIELPLDMGINQLSVWTDKDCQGKISKTISVLPGESAYPNPFVKEVNISVGKEYRTATIKVLDTGGKIVYSGKHTADDGVYSLNLEYLPAGIYMLQLHTGTGIKTFKIIKR